MVYDELDLPFGEWKDSGTSSAGHKGMESIITNLGTDQITRFRVGIKPLNEQFDDAAKYVLSNLTNEESQHLEKIYSDFLPHLKTFILS